MARKKTTGRIYISKSISLDPVLLEKIQERADELKLSFSEYISHIARLETEQKGKPFVIVPIKAAKKKIE